jgi:hypothetical protein
VTGDLPASAIDAADLNLDLLYERDGSGRLLRSRDHSVRAPLLHLVRTVQGNRWLLSAALSEDERTEIEAALAKEPVLSELASMEATPPVLEGVRELLAKREGVRGETGGPAFVFSEPPFTGTAAEELGAVTDLRAVPELQWLRDVTDRERPVYVWRNAQGEVVSLCHCSRSTQAGAHAGVETAAAFRGNGFAVQVVASWANAIRAGGRTPLYSTSWSNAASRAVARKLGLVMFGEDYHLG